MNAEEKKPGSKFSPLLVVVTLGIVVIATVFGFALINAAELERLARESNASYKENVIDQSASLGRVIFAANRVLTFAARPGESGVETEKRRLGASVGLLSHAQYVSKIDAAFLSEQLGDDPLMLGPRSVSANSEYDAALERLRRLADGATRAAAIEGLRKSLDDFRVETIGFMDLLESRSLLLVQLEDYLFSLSKARVNHLLGHSGALVLYISILLAVLAVSIGLYLRSLFRSQAELARHRNHLSLMVEQRTEELTTANSLLVTALREKDTLLKEVYHRVKNNLTMVNSLIALQKAESTPEARAAFDDLDSRISAISLIHEKLYKSNDLENINVEEYIGDLARSLIRSFRDDPESIRMTLNISGIKLPADVLIPLGLITTEIVTNAIKHGFRKRHTGSITIQAKMDEKGFEFSIGDDGEAPSNPETILKSRSLGALLVQELSHQLHGSMELSVGTGTSYRFRFPTIKAEVVSSSASE